jgi:predicted porin
MKKVLLAILAMAGISAAQAQSSVTIYGILDVGYVGSNQQLTSTAGSAKTKTQISQFGQSAESTSRLGFKGNEELGGGTSAFFTAEFQLYPEDQNLSGSSNSGLLNRQTFVGIKQVGYGSTAIGRQYTPMFTAAAKTSPGQFNNVTGDVIFLGGSSGAAGTSTATTITGQENGLGFTNRASNSLTAQTENYYGFSANGMYQLNNKNTTQTAAATGGETNSNGYGLSVEYVWKKLLVNAATQSFTQYTTGTATAFSDVNQGTLVSAKDSQNYAGATYDFGILKAYAQYVQRTITSTIDSSQFAKRSAQQLGIRGNIRSNIDAWASVGNGKFDQYGSTNGTVPFTAYQIGSNYYLSKRTNLYGIFGSTQSSGNQQTTAGAASSKNMYALGVRHTF